MATNDIQTVQIDDQGDLVVLQDTFGNKSFKVIRGQEAIRQDIQVRMLSLFGERILHPTYGLDFPSIETPFDENLVRGEVVRTVLQDPDVEEIVDIEILFDGRVRQASFSGSVRLKDDDVIGVVGVL